MYLQVGYSRTWVWTLEPRSLPSHLGAPGCGEEGVLLPVAGACEGFLIPLQFYHSFLKVSSLQLLKDLSVKKYTCFSMIQLCLTVWARSPKSYEQLRQSGLLLLPSPRQLSRYKNCIPQLSGFHDEVFRWMAKEAERNNIPPEGYVGSLIFDEMSIQVII